MSFDGKTSEYITSRGHLRDPPFSLARFCAIVRPMKISILRVLLLLLTLQVSAFAGNSVVNLSHYDLMRPDFAAMKAQGIVGVIHEASYPRYVRDSYYGTRQNAATRAGLLWGAYHFADATDPIRQAEFFLNTVSSQWRGPGINPSGVLLVLDFEKNGHYPGGSMRVDQAVTFVERIHQRTGRYPGLYCSEYRLRQMLYGPKVTAAQRRVLANCWLWIANYHFEPRNTAPWGHWTMWQYTGDGVCDLPRASYPKSIANIKRAERNIFRGNDAAVQAFWQEHAWNPAE
jgi:lysozyme